MIGPTVDKNIFDVGTLIADRYEVTRFIGSGAMGWVIQVIDKQLDDRVTALKFLYPHLVHDEVSSSRFRNEVVIAQGLSHPSIVRIHDLGRTEGGQFFISMEFVNGVSLKEFLSRQGRPGLKVSTAAKIIFEIAQAIGYAHQNGVVHRDLKPDNIIISDLGAVKLVDFGIARSVWQEHGLTRTGGAVGTPYYMSPEQLNGEKVDYRADIYALGIIAYELVSGEKPFTEDSFLRLAEQHLEQDIPHLCERIKSVPAWYDEIVQKATQKKKEKRYDSALEISRCIEQHIPPGVLSETRVKVVPGTVSSLPDGSSANAVAGVVASIPDISTLADIKKRTFLLAFAGLFVLLGAASGYWLRDGFSLKQMELAESDKPQKRSHLQSKLNAAIAEANTPEVLKLIDAGADVNGAGDNGVSPLSQAVDTGSIDIARVLLENGADPNGLSAENQPLIRVAIEYGDEPLVRLLIKHGANTAVRLGSQRWSLLHLAIQRKKSDIFSLLLAQTDVDPNAAKVNGVTPLHLAVRSADAEFLIRKLVEAGADVDQKAGSGRSPIYPAIDFNNNSAIEALLALGAEINMADNKGHTPLSYAVLGGKYGAVRLLLLRGADKKKTCARGKTALEHAIDKGNAEMIALLKQ